ncbi:helix-turn-helix domain-containing protein [Methylorubrum aminovorans]
MSDDIMAVLTNPTVDVVLAGRVLGIGKNAAYSAARDGSLPSIKIGGQYRVPTAKLREMLGLPAYSPSTAAPIAA